MLNTKMRFAAAGLMLMAMVGAGAAEDNPGNAKLQHLGPLAGKLDPALISAVDAIQSGKATARPCRAGFAKHCRARKQPMRPTG